MSSEAIESAAREIEERLRAAGGHSAVSVVWLRDTLSKHFPPAGIAEQWPKLVESGPLPAGRLIFGQVELARGVYKRQVRWLGIDGTWADNQRACGWKFYDYGPLPAPKETVEQEGTDGTIPTDS